MGSVLGGTMKWDTERDHSGGWSPLRKKFQTRRAKATGLGAAEYEVSDTLNSFDFAVNQLDKGVNALPSVWEQAEKVFSTISDTLTSAANSLKEIASVLGAPGKVGNAFVDANKKVWNMITGGGGSGNGGSSGSADYGSGSDAKGGYIWQHYNGQNYKDYLPNSQGYFGYDEYGTGEGDSSRIGSLGTTLDGSGIGLGADVQKHLGVVPGQWVHVDGRWRRVDETSARNHGVEQWFQDNRDHGYGNTRHTIDAVHRGTDKPADDYKGDGVTQNNVIHFNGIQHAIRQITQHKRCGSSYGRRTTRKG